MPIRVNMPALMRLFFGQHSWLPLMTGHPFWEATFDQHLGWLLVRGFTVDPDLHFYQEFNQATVKCNYYLETKFDDEISKPNGTKDVLSLCHVNIRSARKNLGDFENYLNMLNHDVTVIGLSETWLNDNDSDLYGLCGYKIIGHHRVNRAGGGVAVCVQDHVCFKERPDLSYFSEDCESVFIEVEKGHQQQSSNVIIGVIYRPPNHDISSFNDKMNSIVNVVQRENKTCYLLGDYNIDILNYASHVHTAQFVDMMSSNGFLPLITRPSRVTATSATLIDNIFTNDIGDINHSVQGLFITDISDHFPVFHIAKQMEIEEKDAYIYKRLYGSQNKDNFCHAMSNISWDEISRATDTQQAFDTFHKHLVKMYNKYFPKIRVKKKYNNRKPWLSEGLKNSIKQKNKLYLKFKKVSSVLNDESYKCYKRKLQQLMKVAEKQHYHDLLVEYSNDIKKSWVVIKSIINKNKKPHIQGRFKIGENLITSDKELISNKFNDFFINIGPTLAKSIPCVNKSPLSYLGNRLTESIYLAPVSENEIGQLIKSLKDTTAGFDDLNSMCLKISSRFLLKPLTHICNLSISQGIFPEQLKIANVIPLYKSDDSMSFNNYRPVSVLCVLSKIFEKIMYNRVTAFLEIFKIFHDNQYGFRKKSSTHVALLTFIDKVIEAIENGEYAIGVFLDFSKAFDTVDHEILLNKLDHYGIRGCALSWFKSYLSRRLQYVTYNGSQSSQQMIKCGVPQGSILGPLLFLIYINDLCIVCKSTEPVLFADDTNLFSSGSNAISLQDGVNNDLAIIAEWLKVNKLSLNIKKTHFMCFSAKNKSRPGISLQIDGEAIAEVNKSKFLGVVIDNKLSWKDHISFVCRKVARGIGVIIKARKVLYNESLKCLYYSFIYPYMIYCNQVWGSACKTNIEPLQVLQKRAVRIILGVHPRSPSEPLFTTLKFLNCKNIFKYLIGHLMYRIYHGELHVLHGFFTKNSNIHVHDTRQKCHYHLPLCRTNLGKCGLRYVGASVWNNILSVNINPNVSEFIFSRSLKAAICNNLL